MTDKEIKKIKKEINRIRKNRLPFLAESESQLNEFKRRRIRYIEISILIFTASILMIFTNAGLKSISLGILVSILIFFMSLSLKVRTTIKPEESPMDEWYWKMQNNNALIYILGLPFVFLLTFLVDRTIPIFDFSFNSSIIFTLLFFIGTLFIKIKPLLFLNQKYTLAISFFGLLGAVLFILSFPLIIFSYVNFVFTNIHLSIYFFLVVVLSAFISLKNSKFEGEFNMCQSYLLKLIKPTKILSFCISVNTNNCK